jgi:hypothetical protein
MRHMMSGTHNLDNEGSSMPNNGACLPRDHVHSRSMGSHGPVDVVVIFESVTFADLLSRGRSGP